MELQNATKTNGESALLSTLDRIDRRLARLESAVERLESLERGAPGALAAAADTIDDLADRLREKGVDLDERLRVSAELAERLTSPEALEAIRAALGGLDLVRHLLDAANAAQTDGYSVGLFGAARATSEPDVRRALGFLVRAAQRFGHSLERLPALPAGGEGGAR